MCGGGSNHMPRIMEPFSFEDVCEAGPGAGAYALLGALKTRLFDEKRDFMKLNLKFSLTITCTQ